MCILMLTKVFFTRQRDLSFLLAFMIKYSDKSKLKINNLFNHTASGYSPSLWVKAQHQKFAALHSEWSCKGLACCSTPFRYWHCPEYKVGNDTTNQQGLVMLIKHSLVAEAIKGRQPTNYCFLFPPEINSKGLGERVREKVLWRKNISGLEE